MYRHEKNFRLRGWWLFYGTISPLKFELVLMLIFLNLSWKRFLKSYMTFSFIIVFFLPFLRCVCYKFPNMHSRVIRKLVLRPFLHCKALRTAMYKRYINSINIIIIIIIIFIIIINNCCHQVCNLRIMHISPLISNGLS